MKDDVNHNRSSTKLSSDYYINDPRTQNQNQNLRPKGIPEQSLIDSLQLGLQALSIIEGCEYCRDKLVSLTTVKEGLTSNQYQTGRQDYNEEHRRSNK
jgi:hypothetical protein